MVFTRKDEDFHGRTVSFREGNQNGTPYFEAGDTSLKLNPHPNPHPVKCKGIRWHLFHDTRWENSLLLEKHRFGYPFIKFLWCYYLFGLRDTFFQNLAPLRPRMVKGGKVFPATQNWNICRDVVTWNPSSPKFLVEKTILPWKGEFTLKNLRYLANKMKWYKYSSCFLKIDWKKENTLKEMEVCLFSMRMDFPRISPPRRCSTVSMGFFCIFPPQGWWWWLARWIWKVAKNQILIKSPSG